MDTYKIVCTREKNRILFSAVPHRWETNKNLFWPDNLKFNQLETLRSNAQSIPEADWGKYQCSVKCSNIATFKEALIIERQFTDCSDTEGEQRLFTAKKKTVNQSQTMDRNDLFDLMVSIPDPSEQISNSPYKADDIYNPPAYEGIPYPPEHVVNSDCGNIEGGNELIMVNYNCIENMQKDVAQIKAECAEIKTEYVKINIQLDNIYKLLVNRKDSNSNLCTASVTRETNNFKEFNFPLQTHSSISELENELRNRLFCNLE